MDVNIFATCIGDIVKSNIIKKTVLLLEKLDCKVHFLEQQGCCGQLQFNSGYASGSISNIQRQIEVFEANDFPIVIPAGSCSYTFTKFPELVGDDPAWIARAQAIAERTYDLTQFLVHVLKKADVGAVFEATAVYHPTCSLFRKLGVVHEPLEILSHVKGLTLLPITAQETCCGFGGTFSVKMAEVSGKMVEEKVHNIVEQNPDYLIGADSSCLINIGGCLTRNQHRTKAIHIIDVLVSDQELLGA